MDVRPFLSKEKNRKKKKRRKRQQKLRREQEKPAGENSGDKEDANQESDVEIE